MNATRLATVEDAAALARLHAQDEGRAWSAEEFAQFLSSPGIEALAAPPGPQAVGAFVLTRQVGPEAEVMALLVDRTLRRQGLGRRLLLAAIGRLERRGVRSLFLEVAEDNVAALALYRDLGFARIGRRRGYYQRPGGKKVAARVLQLDLRGTGARSAPGLVDVEEKPS